METKTYLIEPLFERVEEYSKTSLKLAKLKVLDKTADVTSTFLSRFILGTVLSFFALTLTVAIALWLGELTGKNYYGFLLVASFYGLAGISIYFLHPSIKTHLNDSIITKVLN